MQKLAENKRNAQSWGRPRCWLFWIEARSCRRITPCPLTVWQFGRDLTLVGLSGEVVVDYVAFLEKVLGPNQLWIAGYCNDVFGYLPSARVLAEGGYETRGLYAGGAGFFDPKAEEVVVRTVRKLAEQAGRKLPD